MILRRAIAVALLIVAPWAWAADTGWIYAGTAATSAGAGDVDWTNASNATGSNTGTYAEVSLDSLKVSYILSLTNYDLSAIPSGATIDGVEVAVYRQETGSTPNIQDDTVQLIIEGTATGSNKASATGWSGTAGEVTYGGATDRWGVTGLTAAQIKASTSGVRLIIENIGNTGTGRVMYVAIKVYYTPAAGGDWWDSSWSHRIEGTIDATYVDEAIPVVPVWIPSSATAWFSAVDAAGDDIRVFNSDDTVALDYYIVDIDTVAPHCMLLVNVAPIIDTVTDAPFRVYAGNALASAASSSSAVFTGTDYAGYWMPGMTTTDLTGNGFNLTAVNSPGTAASQWDGLTAATYNGTDQYHWHNAGPLSGLPLSLEALKLSSDNANGAYWFAYSDYNTFADWFGLYQSQSSTNILNRFIADGKNASGAIHAPGAWEYTAGTRNAQTSDTTRNFTNGAADGTNTDDLSITGWPLDTIVVGARILGSSASAYFPGNIAQAAVSSVVRSANFVATNYDAWFTAGFITWGSVEEAPSGGANTTNFFFLF